jgi:hypothetical protein
MPRTLQKPMIPDQEEEWKVQTRESCRGIQ